MEQLATHETDVLYNIEEPDVSDLVTEDDEPVDTIASAKQQRLLVDAHHASFRLECDFLAERSGPNSRPGELNPTASLVQRSRQRLQTADAQRRERDIQRWRDASADAARILQLIVTKYRPKRVWQWGSLLRPEQFSADSDIDFALEGINRAETFFALLGDAMALTHFPLDIVQMEHIEPEFADIIRMKGKIVHELGE